MPKKPVIFLAFANDRVDDVSYLRNLPVELDGIRTALNKAQQAGLCEVVERSNLTIKQLLDVFQSAEYKDRIAIFHYGGHANGYQLLLESHDGQHQSAHAEGLTSFLSKQNGLKLVFLNGCSSQQQALDLMEAGLSAIIGTSQSINDDVATSLAIRFYTALAGGASIEKSWEEAVDEVKIQKGTANMRDLFFDGMEELEENHEEEIPTLDRFPWNIFFKEGADLTKQWNLPEAVENPLFGLPAVPPKFHLPETPFRYLQRYTRKEAEVLFGRSYYIRQLYNLVTDPKGAPLVLLYGQSGVGKSSLIDAGFTPRLEQTHTVWYLRRDQGISISQLFQIAGAMKEQVLGIESEEEVDATHELNEVEKKELNIHEFYNQLEGLSSQYQGKLPPDLQELFERMKMELSVTKSAYLKNIKTDAAQQSLKDGELSAEMVNEMPLIDQWLLLEEVTGKPLIIIVDQLESIFTIPDPDDPDEFDNFAEDIVQLFSNPEKLPQGKLVLSYRKEYHPEIDEKFKQLQVPRSRLFLKHLERKDISEVVRGLMSTNRTRQKYQLEVEEELPIIIADDLLEDRDSPIAPVLQILLTKMWQLSHENADGSRRFTIQNYQELRQEGILMEDFYSQQMVVLKAWNPECVESGLALDVMMFHSSSMMTADVRTKAEIHQEYAANIDIIDELLQKLKELYLLSGVQVEGKTLNTLAHDTLAPIVYQHYRSSDYPAQRARRILENRVDSFDEHDIKTALDLTDLAIVETGRFGMRALTEREEALVALSEKRRRKIMLAKKVRRRLAFLAVFLIIGAGIFALIKEREASRDKDKAEIAQKEAEKSEQDAQKEKIHAKTQQKLAEAAEKRAQERKQEAILSAAEAKRQEELARKSEQIALAAQRDAERSEANALAAKEAEADAREKAEASEEEAVAAKDAEEKQKEKAEASERNAQNLKNLALNKEIALKASQILNNPYSQELSGLLALQAYADNQRYEGEKEDRDIYNALSTAWLQLDTAQNNLSTNLGEIQVFNYHASTDWLLGGGTSANLQIWKENAGKLKEVEKLRFDYDQASATRAIEVSPNNRYLASGHEDHSVRLWRLDKDGQKHVFSKRAIELFGHKASVHSLHFVSNKELVTIDIGGRILCWDLGETVNRHQQEYQLEAKELKSAIHPQDQLILLGCSDGKIRSFNHKTGEITIWYADDFDAITAISISQNGQFVAIGDRNGSISIIDYATREAEVFPIATHKSRVTDIQFSAKNTFLASTSYDRSMVMYRVADMKGSGTPKPIIQAKSRGWLQTLSFTPDEQKVIVGGSSRNINIYDTDMEALAQKIEVKLKNLITSKERAASVKAELKNIVRGREEAYYDEIMSILDR